MPGSQNIHPIWLVPILPFDWPILTFIHRSSMIPAAISGGPYAITPIEHFKYHQIFLSYDTDKVCRYALSDHPSSSSSSTFSFSSSSFSSTSSSFSSAASPLLSLLTSSFSFLTIWHYGQGRVSHGPGSCGCVREKVLTLLTVQPTRSSCYPTNYYLPDPCYRSHWRSDLLTNFTWVIALTNYLTYVYLTIN